MDVEAHRVRCSVCNHPKAEELDRRFMDGALQSELADKYGLTQMSVSRHVRALGLRQKREGEFVRMIEDGSLRYLDQVLSGGSIPDRVGLKMVELDAKIKGLLVERKLDLTAEFEGRSEAELKFYAQHGRWPLGAEVQLVQGKDGVPQ